MASQPGGDLSVERLAARIAMSPRNFHRRFTEVFNITPGSYQATFECGFGVPDWKGCGQPDQPAVIPFG
jgi:transcriptional regulator GlxA family with amidase domain